MSNTHRWILGTAIVLIVSLGFLSNALLLRTLDDLRGVRQQLTTVQASEKTGPMTDDEVMQEGDGPRSSLASFGQLLAPGDRATYFMELENGLALIGVEEPTDDPATKHDLTVYLADMEESKLTKLFTRDLSGPGHSVSFVKEEYQHAARVHVVTQWEGYDNRYTDYIRLRDGAHLLTQQYQNGQAIVLTKNGKSLDISLAPKEACKDNVLEPAKRVNVDGLLVNGQEIKFGKAYSVECQPSELLGAGFYPAIDESWYSGNLTAQGEDFLYLRLPIAVEALVDLNNMVPSAIKVRNIVF